MKNLKFLFLLGLVNVAQAHVAVFPHGHPHQVVSQENDVMATLLYMGGVAVMLCGLWFLRSTLNFRDSQKKD